MMTAAGRDAGANDSIYLDSAICFLIEWSGFSLPEQFHSSGLPWLNYTPPFRPQVKLLICSQAHWWVQGSLAHES